jgi:hypothetical protein
MGDQQDAAQRLAEIRNSYEMAVRRGDHAMSRSLVAELLDHIDTLTAKMAEVEADRDALRAVGDELAQTVLSAFAYGRIAALARDYMALVPSPVEGGQ